MMNRTIAVAARLQPTAPSLEEQIADFLLSLLPPDRPRRLARMSYPGEMKPEILRDEKTGKPIRDERGKVIKTGHLVERGKYEDIYVKALTRAMLVEHAAGVKTYSYTLDRDGRARMGALDIDQGGRAALRALLTAAAELGITAIAIENTGNGQHKGGHFVVLFDRFYPAQDIKALMLHIAERAGVETKEVWPGSNQGLRGLFGVHQLDQTRGEMLTQDSERFMLDQPAELAEALATLQALPLNGPPPPAPVAEHPRPAQGSDKKHSTKLGSSDTPQHKVTDLTKRQGGRGLIPRDEYLAILDQAGAYIREHFDLVTELENAGGVKTSGGYSCPFCEHTHETTLTIEPSGNVGYSHSLRCKLHSSKGFDVTNVLMLVHCCNSFDQLARKLAPDLFPPPRHKRHDPPPPAEAPEWQTQAAAERRQKDAERKRQARRQHAADTLADVQARAGADPDLTDCDKAVLRALVDIAGDRGWCRPSKAEIAARSGYSLGSVKRALARPAAGGRLEGRYFASEGDGGSEQCTAVRTFLRGSCFDDATIFCVKDDPRIDLELDLVTDQELVSRAPEPPPAAEGADLETWAWCDDGHGADDLPADLWEAPEVPTCNVQLGVTAPASVEYTITRYGPRWLVAGSDGSGRWACSEAEARAMATGDTNGASMAQYSPAVTSGEPQQDAVSFEKQTDLCDIGPVNRWATIARLFDRLGRADDAERVREEHAIEARMDMSDEPLPILADGAIGYEGGAKFYADGAPNLEKFSKLLAPEVIQLDPLEQAPPAANSPAFGEFIWRYRASQPGAICKRTGKPYSNAQRQRFEREYQTLLVDVSPEEAALRWEAVRAPSKPAGVRTAPPLTSSRAVGPPVVQPLLFGSEVSAYGSNRPTHATGTMGISGLAGVRSP